MNRCLAVSKYNVQCNEKASYSGYCYMHVGSDPKYVYKPPVSEFNIFKCLKCGGLRCSKCMICSLFKS
jgi:hypothetical protein